MDRKLLEEAKRLAEKNYLLSVFEDTLPSGEKIYMAKNPELAGCMAQGMSIEKAIANLADARLDYIYDSLEDGIPIPEPAMQPVPRGIETTTTTNPGQTLIVKSVPFQDKTLEDSEQVSSRMPLYEAWVST
jgi:predicted RNase H-like HicB family nuclease